MRYQTQHKLLFSLLLFTLFFPTTSISAQSYAAETEVLYDLSSGWQYSWQGPPPLEAGGFDWPESETAEWTRISFPSNPPGRDDRRIVWYRVQIPKKKIRDPSLFIFSIDINADFYLDGEKIYSYGSISSSGEGRFIGWPIQLFPLPSDSGGKTLFVRVYSDYRDIGLWGDIFFGSRAELLTRLYQRDIFGVLVLIVSLLIGLVFIGIFFLSGRKNLSSLYLSIVSFLVSLRVLGQLYIPQLYVQRHILFEYSDVATSTLLPLFITLLFRAFLDGRYRKVTGFLWKLNLLLFFLSILFPLVSDYPLHAVYTPLDINALLLVGILVYISIKILKCKDKEKKYFSINFLITAILVLYSEMMSRAFVPWFAEIDYLVVFQFSLGLSLILARRFALLYRDHEQQSRDLSKLNRRLEEEVKQRTVDLQEANEELSRLNEELQKERNELRLTSITDGLTGLYNRTYIEEQFRHLVKEAGRYQHAFTIAMFDLDHFKKVNDEFGHHTGDKVLRQVAGVLATVIRGTDIAGRYGGEEFLLLFPQTDAKAAAIVTERIRHSIQKLSFTEGPEQVTISGGLAEYTGQASDVLLKEADMNMYEAKHRGRNCVVFTADSS